MSEGSARIAGVLLHAGAIESASAIGISARSENPNAGTSVEETTLWFHDDNGIIRPHLGSTHLALFLRAVKEENTARTTNTVSLDPDLVVNVGAGRRYIVEAHLITNENVDATGIKVGLGGGCTTSKFQFTYDDGLLAGAFNYNGELADLSDIRNTANPLGGDAVIELNGFVKIANAGTFGVNWARNSAVAGTATIKMGSWLKLTEVA